MGDKTTMALTVRGAYYTDVQLRARVPKWVKRAALAASRHSRVQLWSLPSERTCRNHHRLSAIWALQQSLDDFTRTLRAWSMWRMERDPIRRREIKPITTQSQHESKIRAAFNYYEAWE